MPLDFLYLTKPSKRAVRGAILLAHYCSHHQCDQ